jgi:hypothetical protein
MLLMMGGIVARNMLIKAIAKNKTHILYSVLLFHKPYLFHHLKESDCDRIVTLHVRFLSC